MRVEGWRVQDGRHERFVSFQAREGTELEVHVTGFQQADGQYREVRIFVGDCELGIDDVDTVIGDLVAARDEARALHHAD